MSGYKADWDTLVLMKYGLNRSNIFAANEWWK